MGEISDRERRRALVQVRKLARQPGRDLENRIRQISDAIAPVIGKGGKRKTWTGKDRKDRSGQDREA